MTDWQTAMAIVTPWILVLAMVPTFIWALRRKRTVAARRIARHGARMARLLEDPLYADRVFDTTIDDALYSDPALLDMAERGSIALAAKD
jgi:hypothetical protein